jgi:hypothetical protein
VVADANCVGHLPFNVDFVQIAPILCAGITVYKCLKVLGSSALPLRGKTKRNFPRAMAWKRLRTTQRDVEGCG